MADLKEAGKVWAGNGNSEEMFQVQYMNSNSWNGTIGMGFCNQVELYTGLRCDADENSKSNGGSETFPFGQGWGQGTSGQTATRVRRLPFLMLLTNCRLTTSRLLALRMLVIITRSGFA